MKKLTEMTKKELYKLAQEKEIKNRSKMDKLELMKALMDLYAPVKKSKINLLKDLVQTNKERKNLVSLNLQFFASKKIPWCTSHYSTDFAKKKAKELRDKGYKVSFGSYVKEEGKSYCKIYLEMNLNYHVIHILDMVKFHVTHGKLSILEAVEKQKKNIIDTCKQYETGIRIELENNTIIARINNEYELKEQLV